MLDFIGRPLVQAAGRVSALVSLLTRIFNISDNTQLTFFPGSCFRGGGDKAGASALAAKVLRV
jgi:hypothetical protein